MIRLRQLLDQIRHRLLVVPLGFVVLSLLVSQAMLRLDRSVDDDSIPTLLLTTVDSGRSILTAIAGGLISSITLLLSMMLVAVQLASSQFSPRTVRNWLGDRTQQAAIGLVLGTAVYCLLILRETRALGEGDALVPHLSVVVALILNDLSLVAVVRSVDHLTNQLRIGSIASGIMDQTLTVIAQEDKLRNPENPAVTPAGRPASPERLVDPPAGATAVTAPVSGWVQQIDQEALFECVPAGATAYIQASLGSFVMANTPVVWVWDAPLSDESTETIRAAIAIGDARTMQQDIGFGIMQMVDIALRALSPGVNDPNTANDMIMHLGVVMLSIWDTPVGATVRDEDGRSLIRHDLDHADYLHAAFDQIRRYGASDPEVSATIIRALATLHAETTRRSLQGPLGPIEELVDRVLESVERSDLCAYDKDLVRNVASDALRPTP